MNVGLIGCGNISGIYLKNLKRCADLRLAAVADLEPGRAQNRAQEFDISKTCSPDELLADPDIHIVVNLTVPQAHAEVTLKAIAAGKHVYTEKPLATTRADGARIVAAAREKGLRVSGAPETFLGAGLQTCRKLIDDGAIGTPVGATAFMGSIGPEGWHPDPDFFYQPGAGPLFDMGPYYLTALVHLLGAVRRVSGSARITRPQRLIGSQPRRGESITVRTPTHVAGVLDFTGGPVATFVTSFDVWASTGPRLEVYGTEGALTAPDPNTFGGPVRLWTPSTKQWNEAPLTHANSENSRGIGVGDLARAIRMGRPHRASGELAFHVLDVMQAMLETSEAGRHIDVTSTCERPAPLPTGLNDWELD